MYIASLRQSNESSLLKLKKTNAPFSGADMQFFNVDAADMKQICSFPKRMHSFSEILS